jgi:hypothetical protein
MKSSFSWHDVSRRVDCVLRLIRALRLRRAGAVGRGVYFAESAPKSDQYVSRSAAGKLTLVLARVCLGRCQFLLRDGRGRSQRLPFLPEVEGRSTPVVAAYYDSILTEVTGMRFREVVVGRDMAARSSLWSPSGCRGQCQHHSTSRPRPTCSTLFVALLLSFCFSVLTRHLCLRGWSLLCSRFCL